MRKDKDGDYYENFKSGRVFIKENERSIIIKVYGTYCGRINQFVGWLCVSWRSRKPIVYSFTEGRGIRNIVYWGLESQTHNLINKVVRCRNDVKKSRKLQKKFVGVCSKRLYGESLKIIDLNGKIVKTWLPLLSCFDNQEIAKATEALQSSLIRKGLKEEVLEAAVTTWFKQSPPELTRRIEFLLFSKARQITLKHRLTQLTLLIACREWNLQDLYSLCDLSIHCYFPLNVEKAKQLFATYSPQCWLSIFENLAQNYHNFFLLGLAVNDFAGIDYQSHLLPQELQSIEQISDALNNLIYPCQISCEEESPFCCCDASPILLMLDCPVCGKPYSS